MWSSYMDDNTKLDLIRVLSAKTYLLYADFGSDLVGFALCKHRKNKNIIDLKKLEYPGFSSKWFKKAIHEIYTKL